MCENFRNYFEIITRSIHTRNNGNLIRLPKVKTEAARKSFSFVGGKSFNELPSRIRTAKHIKEFKKQLNLYIFEIISLHIKTLKHLQLHT